ncbi:polyhydroxyalkanoic acid synthase [Cobetia amphilecti]|nr:polyhydroxyalkanoic acid synthase [Cobetia litoralis]
MQSPAQPGASSYHLSQREGGAEATCTTQTSTVSHAIEGDDETTLAPSLYDTIDRIVHAGVARSTLGLSPSVLAEAWMDWAVHMAISPGKQMQLLESALWGSWAVYQEALGIKEQAVDQPDGKDQGGKSQESEAQESGAKGRAQAGPHIADRRFRDAAWQQLPFSLWANAHAQNWQWWQQAVTGVHGMSPAHENLLAFVSGLMVDTLSPSNYAQTNPEVMTTTLSEGGKNLMRGAQHLMEDLERRGRAASATPASTSALHDAASSAQQPPVEVGQTLAITPGKVVMRNRLIELIQYSPATETVQAEPVLIVPAWIMKYYILDLSPHNSLVRFLVNQGYSVFMVSWTNPDATLRDMGLEDYRHLGVLEAIDAIQAVTAAKHLHAVGYCLGGTLLSIAAAAMGRDGDERLASVSLFAAQTDFTEAGELRLFISDSQVTLIEDMMADKGYLSSEQMAGTFALLRARDLIWAPVVDHYLLGKPSHSFDLMTWNADATRMPATMHAEYLRRLYLNNDLAEGHYRVAGKAVSVSDIRAPIFAVGTEDDHVAPWESVYKLHLFADSEMTFVLANGGHNAGIISEPGHSRRHYRIATTGATDAYRAPNEWLSDTTEQDGSWWPAFANWLEAHSSQRVAPPPMGMEHGRYRVLCDAPGTYVKQT